MWLVLPSTSHGTSGYRWRSGLSGSEVASLKPGANAGNRGMRLLLRLAQAHVESLAQGPGSGLFLGHASSVVPCLGVTCVMEVGGPMAPTPTKKAELASPMSTIL